MLLTLETNTPSWTNGLRLGLVILQLNGMDGTHIFCRARTVCFYLLSFFDFVCQLNYSEKYFQRHSYLDFL